MTFQCDKCGACCRSAECAYLNNDNTCSIYDMRPITCNVEKMFSLTGGDLIFEKEKYFNLIHEFCDFLRKKEVSNGLRKKG